VARTAVPHVFDDAQKSIRIHPRLRLFADRLRFADAAAPLRLAGHQEIPMGLGTILLIVLILILIGAVPAWPHSRGWGYGPSGVLGLVVLVLVVMLLTGRL
jgi:hypothetical protein